MIDIIKLFLNWLLTLFGQRRNVRATVHLATFQTGLVCYFINVTNLSATREVEITHVYFDTNPQSPVVNPDRPLPKRLKPDESWETWIPIERLPGWVHAKPYQLARVRLSSGKIIKSEQNKNVPETGEVPGGPVTHL